MPPSGKIKPWTLTKHNMKKQLSTIALAATAVFAASASAQAGEVTPGPAVASSNASGPWSLSAEALRLKAHSNEDNYDEQDYETGFRLALGYKSGDNLGLRFRMFEFDSNSSDNVEIDSYDLEVFDHFTLGSWNGEFSFGVRYLEFNEPDDDDAEVEFNGFGPTVGVEFTRPISGPLSVYVGARTGLIYGDDDVNDDSSFAPVAELSVGLQYDFSVVNHAAYVRLGVDAQNYASISDDDNEDTGLFGAALKVGFSF